MSIEIQPYFAEGERYPALIGVRAQGDEYETAYVSKSELVDALSENAKLRELCWRMRTYMAGVVEHNGYQIMTTGYTMLGGRIKECDKAMQALGIEVDA